MMDGEPHRFAITSRTFEEVPMSGRGGPERWLEMVLREIVQ